LVSADVKIKTSAEVYDAFDRGDIAAILSAITPNSAVAKIQRQDVASRRSVRPGS